MIRTSQPGWNEGAITLSASRSRLRTLFRTTAPPSLRPVDRPKRVSSRPVLRIRTTSREWDLTVPSPCSAAKSSGLESITTRGELWPRSVVRPLASCDRERGGRPTPGVPRLSSSGRGSRVPWRDAASWADRSASWEGVFLSIRPRGQDTPKGTRTRRAHESALARLPADYMYACVGVSNEPRLGVGRYGRFLVCPADTPREYANRNVREPCPGHRGGAILRRPAVPDNPGRWPRGTVRTVRALRRRA